MADGGDEEEDYMSDKFLFGAADTRPGLPILKRVAKQYNKDERHKVLNEKNKIKPIKEREKEQREQGMASAIDNSNVGFALLQKMGYKKGAGLGKEGTGRADPIPIAIKTDRGGLGRETQIKRQQQKKQTLREETAKKRTKLEQHQREHFRQQISNKFAEKKIKSDLYKSQKACEQLDKAKGQLCKLEWFWPQETSEEEEEENEEEKDDEEDGSELQPHEMLRELTAYLRTQHLYCIWCGTTFDDPEDLADNCPGDTAAEHD
ncbi:predicted protein [Nematostella vectensis]|uniref:G patch domain-containing protein 11 n=1 Tax=Nematostella vectensis TaxID=45351 RepID=A7S7M8_NEMVE|nr:predicted protein [Nematostella vectensis]|eukprot:XP_001632287.1 predicted protein [Nematostella vectensis]